MSPALPLLFDIFGAIDYCRLYSVRHATLRFFLLIAFFCPLMLLTRRQCCRCYYATMTLLPPSACNAA